MLQVGGLSAVRRVMVGCPALTWNAWTGVTTIARSRKNLSLMVKYLILYYITCEVNAILFSLQVSIEFCFYIFYASATVRCRGHYVFGLSVRACVRVCVCACVGA